MLDTTPGDIHALKLRPDDKSKEIVPPMRLKPRDPIERLVENLKSRGRNSVIPEVFNDSKVLRQIKNLSYDYRNKDHSLDPGDAKKVLPELHSKTHFKGAHHLYINTDRDIENKLQEDSAESSRAISLNPRL